MGLIKKKTAIRGTEGGVKYVCDVCSVDITATVSACRLYYAEDGKVLACTLPGTRSHFVCAGPNTVCRVS